MAPKKNRKQAQETMLEEPVEDRIVPSESIGEEEPKTWEDEDEFENEEEQRNSVLFTPKQLEFLLKMNRPDFNELVAALKGGSSKNPGYQPAKPMNFDGARDRKVVACRNGGLYTCCQGWTTFGHGACPILLEKLCRHMVGDNEIRGGE
jgi:hypothetical protein